MSDAQRATGTSGKVSATITVATTHSPKRHAPRTTSTRAWEPSAAYATSPTWAWRCSKRYSQADERTSRVWIQGDLHAENFGTYMDGDGVFIFDVNDFDEAYLGPSEGPRQTEDVLSYVGEDQVG